jgi:hypothetical protein
VDALFNINEAALTKSFYATADANGIAANGVRNCYLWLREQGVRASQAPLSVGNAYTLSAPRNLVFVNSSK